MTRTLRHALSAAFAGLALFAAGAQAAQMTIYGQPDFRGKSFTLRGNANLADINFENRVSSLVIHSGTWEVCTEADLRGRCETFGPGEYPNLGRFDDRIESMRVLQRSNLQSRGSAYYDERHADRGNGVEIWSQPNFSGKTIRLRGETVDLTPHGMQDQASSIVVHEGTWEFCTQPNFRGTCVQLQRGTYPTLEQELTHRVESVRRVDRDYIGRR
jgi:hypothetical protein